VNITEISNKSKLPYSTTRKYLMLLEDAKLLESKLIDGSRVFADDAVRYVRRLARMSKEGLALPEAIEKIRLTPYAVSDDSELAGLQKQVEDMKRSIQAMNEMLQVNLARKELPERSGFWYHFKAAFSSLFRRK